MQYFRISAVLVLISAAPAFAQESSGAGAAAVGPIVVPQKVKRPPLRAVVPSAALEAGWGFDPSETDRRFFLGRLRLGVASIYEPIAIAIGMTGEVGGLGEHAAGVEVQLYDFAKTFLSFQFGASLGADWDWMTHMGVGIALFGIEWQHRFDSGMASSDAILFKLSVPVGIITSLIVMDERRRRSQ